MGNLTVGVLVGDCQKELACRVRAVSAFQELECEPVALAPSAYPQCAPTACPECMPKVHEVHAQTAPSVP